MAISSSNLATSANTFVLTGAGGERPPEPPKGLIATRAVETKNGWMGQVLVDKEIVWQGDPITQADVAPDDERQKPSEIAQQEANELVVGRIKRLFTEP